MLFEILILFGVFITLLLFFSEIAKMPALGLIGGLSILLLSYWILTDDIQIKTGELINATITRNGTDIGETFLVGNAALSNITNGSVYNETANGTINFTGTETVNKTVTYQFDDIPPDSVASFYSTFGLLLLLLGIYITIHYVMELFSARYSE